MKSTNEATGHAERLDRKIWDVLQEVRAERSKQEAKWGEQNHTILGVDARSALEERRALRMPTSDDAKAYCDATHRAGHGTYASILAEEVCEVLDAAEQDALRGDGSEDSTRKELVQVSAVAVAMIECIDRRAAARIKSSEPVPVPIRRPLRVYLTAPFADAPACETYAALLRAELGVQITSTWHANAEQQVKESELGTLSRAAIANTNFSDLDSADVVLIVLHEPPPYRGGCMVEAGYALGRGKKVFVLTPHYQKQTLMLVDHAQASTHAFMAATVVALRHEAES